MCLMEVCTKHISSLSCIKLYYLFTSHLKQDITERSEQLNKMPFSRGKKPTTSKIPKLHPKGLENQVYNEIRSENEWDICFFACCWPDPSCVDVFKQDGPQTKRSSSPPQGAPKKRTAFVDITNVRMPNQICVHMYFVYIHHSFIAFICYLTRLSLSVFWRLGLILMMSNQ